MKSLCRICLEDGANFSIFEPEDQKHSIKTKISACLHEEIADITGYPTNICGLCNSTLDIIYNFICRFNETCSILGKQLSDLQKDKDQNIFLDIEPTEAEIKTSDVKTELELPYDEAVNVSGCESDNIIVETKTKQVKRVLKKRVLNRGQKISKELKTNSVASSILENAYVWSNEHWRLQSAPKVIQETKKPLYLKREHHKLTKKKSRKNPNPEKLCDLCGQVFKNQDKLTKHKTKFHSSLKYACPHEKCTKVCNTRFNLDRHFKRLHTSQKDYVCSACGARFAFKAELTHHTKRHNSNGAPKRVYSCKFCEKSYKCQKSVDIHERSVHTGLRPAVCSLCDSAFYHDDYLKEHMRLHTGEKPFKCPICARGYAQRGNMKSHLRIHRVSELDDATRNSMRPNYLKLLKA